MSSKAQNNFPTWTGNGFMEEDFQELWLRLPLSLRQISSLEIDQGNAVTSIWENKERNIVILAFRKGPLTEPVNKNSLKIHTKHEYGNYCYDATNMTYEDLETGCFLIFDDSKYDEREL